MAPATPAVSLPASPEMTPYGDLVSTLQASGHFKILVKALDVTNLSATLKTTPQLTLFAPTDEAFKALPPGELAALMEPQNLPILQKVLIYHLVHLNLDSSKIKGAKGPVATVENSPIVLDGSGAVMKVNNADIIQPDVTVAGGNIIQVVDKVLIPTDVILPTIAAATSSETKAGS